MNLISTLECPVCGARTEEHMPRDACVYFNENSETAAHPGSGRSSRDGSAGQ